MTSQSPQVLRWEAGMVRLLFSADADRPVSLASMSSTRVDAAPVDPDLEQPLVELSAFGHGRFPGSFRHVDTTLGRSLRYRSHEESSIEGVSRLVITQGVDAAGTKLDGLAVRSVFEVADDVAAFRTWTTVSIEGDATLDIDFLSVFATGAWLPDSRADVDSLLLTHAANDWVAESRWRTDALRDIGLARIDRELQHHPPRSRAVVANRGSWSTGENLPTGVLHSRDGSYGIGWQIEHNGPWLFELGETRRGAYVLLAGPTDQENHWVARLDRDHPVTSPKASIALATDGPLPVFDRVLGTLTDQRRAIRSTREVDEALPVGFNDYMNTLMGDPTTEKLLPLIDAAAEVGAELFCVDAGWYSDGHWWDEVGEWLPAQGRFPGGIAEVIDRIRERGMLAGLWLEPEVIGVRSTLAASLPDSAFFRRHGVRVAEHGRHLLDLRSPEARAHLNAVVDRIVGDYGVSFFKMDYNTMVGPGTDEAPDGTHQAPGFGAAEHAAAVLDWLDEIQARHPRLLIENCASGAMRMDYAMLSRLHLQSTSDQQDPVLYAPIAAMAPASILPEQAGNWAYPDSGMSEERLVLSLSNAILGRMYLSGYLNRMTAAELARVREAVAVHKALLPVLATTRPFWPLGLTGWEDEWVCLGLDAGAASGGWASLTVWHRADDTSSVELALPAFAGDDIEIDTVFPSDLGGWEWEWERERGVLHARTAVPEPSARVIRIRRREGAA